MESSSPKTRLTPQLAAIDNVLQGCRDIVFMTDPEGLITFVNRAFTESYGYAPDEVVGCATPRVLRSGLRPPEQVERFWRTLLAGERVSIEVVNRARDGRLMTIEGSAGPIIQGDALVGFLAVQRDVTEQRQREERHHLAHYTLERAADAVFWIRADGRILWANDAASLMFGYSPDELRAMALSDIESDCASKPIVEHFALGGSEGSSAFESRWRKKDGSIVPVEVTIGIRDAGGRRCGCAIVRDMSEPRRLEDQFRHAQKMAAVGRLAGGIAHDFNNVLTAILGHGELLSTRVLGLPELARDVEEIRRAATRAGRLTQQLLAFSRKQVVAPEVIDLTVVLRGIDRMLRRLIGEDIKLRATWPPSLGRVKVDVGQIEQVLMNLAVNARDAMPAGGTLTIALANVPPPPHVSSLSPGMAYVSIQVSDTGSGISEDVLPQIFEPFFTTKPRGKGTGLGLSTVYEIVQQSGGDIGVTSTPGAGTTFTIYLPQTPDVAACSVVVAESTRGVDAGHTVLVVEDEAAVRMLVGRILVQHGYAVLDAADALAAEALARRHSGPIHLLLSDIVMPGLSGPALAQRIVTLRPDIRVLYVSGFPMVLDIARLNGRTSFLPKPFTPATLIKQVRKCLDATAAA